MSSIDLLEQILSQGVRDQDLPRWQSILSKSGVTVEELSCSLEKFGSLEALTLQMRKQARELIDRTGKLDIQVKALMEQRDGAKAAVEAVRESALEEVRLAGQQLAKEMEEAGELAQALIEGTVLKQCQLCKLAERRRRPEGIHPSGRGSEVR